MNIFEKASRLNLHIQTTRGNIHHDRLWSIPNDSEKDDFNLVKIGEELYKKLPQGEDIFGRGVISKTNELDELRFEIVKHIIKAHDADALAKAKEMDERKMKQKVRALLEEKEEDALRKEIEKLTPEQIKEKFGL